MLEIKRDVLFVPELTPVPKLLRQFQTSHVHMAVGVDEYGATRGIVTLEDVIEEIVGETEDEFDPAVKADFVKEGEAFRVAGDFPPHTRRQRLQLAGPSGADFDTVGGYAVKRRGRWPRTGDTAPLGDYSARATAVQQKRLAQVPISPRTQEVSRKDGPGEA